MCRISVHCHQQQANVPIILKYVVSFAIVRTVPQNAVAEHINLHLTITDSQMLVTSSSGYEIEDVMINDRDGSYHHVFVTSIFLKI